jgi:alpha/beta hydrolase family protein
MDARRWWKLLGVTVVLAGLVTTSVACSSDDDDDAEGDDVTDEEQSGPVPGEDVARPTVSGPVTGGTQDQMFNAMPDALREEYGYVEEEYFLEGEATAYQPEGELSEDGVWTVTEAGTAPYQTRIIVRRPESADDFDGTVFVEWLNVSGGIDADPDFSLLHPEILRRGSAYVGVSAQRVGVEGGGGPIEIPGVEVQALKQWDPERYGELSHPGDQYSYDIYSQAAQAVRRPGDVDVLDGLEAQHVIAMGESQSAARMVSYVDGVHPVAEIYDGFLVHSRGGGGAPLDDTASILGDGTARIRDDLDVPVLQFLTESDLFGVLGYRRAQQDDAELLRTWEVAGTAHADQSILDYNAEFADEAGGGMDLGTLCGSINDGPQAEVVRAALAALRTWVVDGEAPPEAPPIETDGETIVRDERGIAQGGIRTPAVDAPVSVLTGEAPEGASVLCMLFGETRPFDAATLAELYPSHDDYVTAVTDAADAAVEAGFLLQEEADELVAEAEEAAVPS